LDGLTGTAPRQEQPVDEMPRLSSVAGVARALIATVGVRDAVDILIAQFGWDVAFSACSLLEGPDAGAALWQSVAGLVLDDLAA